MPVTRADMLEGLLIAASVFIVTLVLALVFVALLVGFQVVGASIPPAALPASTPAPPTCSLV